MTDKEWLRRRDVEMEIFVNGERQLKLAEAADRETSAQLDECLRRLQAAAHKENKVPKMVIFVPYRRSLWRTLAYGVVGLMRGVIIGLFLCVVLLLLARVFHLWLTGN